MKDVSVHYRVEPYDVNAHLWQVSLTIAQPRRQQMLSLPVWIPGSYLVREFARHLQQLQAKQDGKACEIVQVNKCTWRMACVAGKPLELRYQVYAQDHSVRAAWLHAQRGFFNPTSLCLRAHGLDAQPHGLTLFAINSIASCAVSTGATALKGSKKRSAGVLGEYRFDNYDHLADTPFEVGQFWHGSFKLRGITHELSVTGATASFDGARLLADIKKIVESALTFWHGKDGKAPFERYVFMLSAVDDGYGGLEHRNSTALICSRRDLPRLGVVKHGEGYTTLLGLISHEYFHAWNVKRLKPKEFLRYDYDRENYTRMLWFFEGFTSYYDDLLLRRAGLIDDAQYLNLLTKTINQVHQTPGRRVQSIAQASMDAWVKYYRQDENTPNATVSYYTKGALVALCFDLSLRQAKKPSQASSLDALMRLLWRNSNAAQNGQGGITQADFTAALRNLSGRSWVEEIAQWVHGTSDLPLQTLLAAQGVTLTPEPTAIVPLAQRLGLRVSETAHGIVIKNVMRGGLAEQAGFATGDEWLAIDDWRIHKLDELTLLSGQAPQVQVLLSRDKRLLRLTLQLPGENQAVSSFSLRSANEALLHTWLLG